MKCQVLSFSTKIKRHSLATSAFQWFPPSQVPNQNNYHEIPSFLHKMPEVIVLNDLYFPSGLEHPRGFPSFLQPLFMSFNLDWCCDRDEKLATARAENRKSASFNQVFALRVWSLKYIFHIPTIRGPWHGQLKLSSPCVTKEVRSILKVGRTYLGTKEERNFLKRGRTYA